MYEPSEHPFNAFVVKDATTIKEEYGIDLNADIDTDMDMDIDLDLDLGMGSDAEAPATVIADNEVSTQDEVDPTDIDDVVLEYKNMEYPCNTHTLKRGSKVFNNLLQDYEASQSQVNCQQPEVVSVSTFSECESPEVFYATLEVCYSGAWTRENAWELHMSYLSCVKIWLIGHHFGIDAMKDIATAKAASVTETLTQRFIVLSEGQERIDERAHLASLIRAVKLANRHEWHAALWKMLYDAGEAVAPKLVRHTVFQSYVKTPEGEEYARAIRATEQVKPKVTPKAEMGRGRNNGGVTKKRPFRGNRHGRKSFGPNPHVLQWH
ncbi:hypothetical protein PG993_006587 [Apiospora rasikravindrae]|uniref:BTB domain-containing protein n=1 Tax=Apiospora rasikravindrae TaxID=990691 RepID=A0ABR1T894_9PEZI